MKRGSLLLTAAVAALGMPALGNDSAVEAPIAHRGYRQGRRSIIKRAPKIQPGEKLAKKAAKGRVGLTHATRGLLPAITGRYPFSAKRGA